MAYTKPAALPETEKSTLQTTDDRTGAGFDKKKFLSSGEPLSARVWSARIEQPGDAEKRLKYHPATDSFTEKDEISLSYARGVPEASGWLEESGTPPCEHLDVIVMGEKKYLPGDREPVRVIGVYKREDGDHKLVAVPLERPEQDLSELPETEREHLKRFMPVDGPGEGWMGRETAEKIIRAFFERKKRKIVLLVQHTEAEHHINGCNGAGYDWHLTENGHKQAQMIGRWLKRWENGEDAFELIASPMNRAWETAEEIQGILHIPCEPDLRLREIDDGEGNGKSREWCHLHRIPAPEGYDPDYRHFPSGESDRDIWNRIYPFYEELMNSDRERVLIVAHGCTMSFLIAMLMGHRFEDIRGCISSGPSGSISKIVIEPDDRRMIRFLNTRIY